MKIVIGLILSVCIVCGIGYALNHTVIQTHNLEQRNE